MASAIHGASSEEEENDERPFESIDCGEVSPNELVEQLIGPDKCGGGLVEKVEGGVLLIENIDRLPIELQPDLGNAIRKGKARFLFTTAADLDAAVADGTFDESLFYRISTQSIDWPGNFAEFRQVIENAVADCKGDAIEASDLPDCIRKTKKWSSLADYLEAASREYKARILNACQGDSKQAAKILGCKPSEVC